MKRILTLILSVLMVATACASMVTVFAVEGDPVKVLDGDRLNPGSMGGHATAGEYSYENGYITWTVTNGLGGVDPYVWVINNDSNQTIAPYLVMKYRTADITKGVVFASSNGGVGSFQTRFDYAENSFEIGDGWSLLVLDLPALLGDHYNTDTNVINHVRLDFADHTDEVAAVEGTTMDVEYIAFFEFEGDAESYEHTLPADPEADFGGCYKTIDFTGKTTEEIADMFHGDQIDVTFAASEGGVLFTATGADPYVTLKNPGAGDHNLGITGTQARYVLVKYNAVATSNDPMQMALFANVQGTPIQWGHPQSLNEADIVADGEWHYVLFDMTSAWGLFNNGLEAFRLDMLHAAAAGETAEIATLKFFSKEAWVKEFVVAQAATDAAAEEMAIANGWMACPHANTVEIPAVPATCTTDGATAGTKCAVCGETVDAPELVPAAHDFSVDVEAKPATETEEGYTAHKKCANCDATEGKTVIPVIVPETTTQEEETTTEPEVTTAIDETTGEDTTADETAGDETTTAADDTAAAGDDTTAAGDDTTKATEDTTATPAAEGCKAVIASASILGVIALAAGAVICKKKD